MGQYKTEAILLTARDWGDVDRMVTLFSKDYGKITAVAYGARRPRSQLAGAVQPFTHTEIALVSGKSYDSIKQCEVLNTFRTLREDLSKLAYATFLAELAIELWPEREAEPQVFELLLAAFTMLSNRNPRITALAGAFQMLVLAGFKPVYADCVVCGKTLEFPAAFDSHAGGSCCRECGNIQSLEYTMATNQFIVRLLELDWNKPQHFTVNGAVLMQTEKLMADFITYRLDKKLKSMAFIAAIT